MLYFQLNGILNFNSFFTYTTVQYKKLDVLTLTILKSFYYNFTLVRNRSLVYYFILKDVWDINELEKKLRFLGGFIFVSSHDGTWKFCIF